MKQHGAAGGDHSRDHGGVIDRPRLAIDARAAVRPELGGVERWARELTVRLPALRPGGYVVLGPPRAFAHRAGARVGQCVLPLRAARSGATALLCPANLAPVGFPRTVVVLHDAAPLRHPGWYSRSYVAWQRRLLPLVARRARHVITVSEFSRAELEELTGLSPERVSVVPGGVDGAFSPAADAERARAALGLARPYVLCVASHTSRKTRCWGCSPIPASAIACAPPACAGRPASPGTRPPARSTP